MRTLDQVAGDISRILRELGIDYVIVGGIAVGGWGNVRTTRDVDVILDIQEKDVTKFRKAMRKKGFDVIADDIKDALREKTHFTVFDTRSDYHVDVKGCYGLKERRSLKTKKAVKLRGKKIFIASSEDTIANKLVFGSEQDIKDAEGIYVRQMEKLNKKYLEEICNEMGVGNKLVEMKNKVKKILAEQERKSR